MKTRIEMLALLGLVCILATFPIAEVHPAAVKVLHTFGAFLHEGLVPQSTLIQAKDGNFYGTTQISNGGNGGTVFKITPDGALTTLYVFESADSHDINSGGGNPFGGVIQGTDGNLYGTTKAGGTHSYGTVFKLTLTGELTVLHNFAAQDGAGTNADGGAPSGLIEGKDGNFYGTTFQGGQNGVGTAFKITSSGAFTTLHSFSSDDTGDNNGGAQPGGALVQGSDGSFYGTTTAGGSNSYGTVFKMTASGAFTSLHNFNYTTGGQPIGKLVQGKDGDFYGVTYEGGSNGYGIAYKITSSGTFTPLHNFSFETGSQPFAGLVQGKDGDFYGTTQTGGQYEDGALFKMTASGKFTPLHSFGGANLIGGNRDGFTPDAALIQGTDGNFYGVNTAGGTDGYGTIFKVTTSGAVTPLHSFGSLNGDGAAPTDSLVFGKDGDLYGTAAYGGSDGIGTVFKVTEGGAFTTLHPYHYTEGGNPEESLVQGADGDFYGTSTQGGPYDSGTVFKITPSGTLTVLHQFTAVSAAGAGNQDGGYPDDALIIGKDGNFYGTAQGGGEFGSGTIFKVTSSGAFTTLYSFSFSFEGSSNDDGSFPLTGLIQGKDGNLYGTTTHGGTGGFGTIFKITTGGSFTTLHSFTAEDSHTINADGAYPLDRLVQGSDGNFYGTADQGGANGYGTVFKLTAAGKYSVLHTFSAENGDGANSDGAFPQTALIQAADGNFYGAATAGGANGSGTLFRITPGGAFTTMYAFPAVDAEMVNAPGAFPIGLVQGANDEFYLTTHGGGAGANGTLVALTLPPVVTSPRTATATRGQEFSYQIKGTNKPASYHVANDAPGLTINTTTGVISGKPTVSGVKTLTLSAVNAGGTGTEALTLTIKAD